MRAARRLSYARRMLENDEAALCSFCGKHRDVVRWLVAGERATLCDECIAACNEMLATAAPGWVYGTPYPLPIRVWPDRRCAFCGRSDAAKFIASTLPSEAPPESTLGHSVCDRCVVYCNDHLVLELKRRSDAGDQVD